ncbi:MAG: chemotaxis protein [Myxococcales bacterium]|nr:chemotaxis protein [Myxococcales bacterium]
MSVGASEGNVRRAAAEKRRRARTMAKQQQAAERVAVEAGKVASGLTDTAAARDQLSAAMRQIAQGSEEASAACQESLAAATEITNRLGHQTKLAAAAGKRVKELRSRLDTLSDDIQLLVENVSSGAERQTASAAKMSALEQQADNINEAVKAVMRIADQTNLLALNAAIEAARAGKHGKGFAVVADTVRKLAETSEKNAANITDLIVQIQEGSRKVGETVRGAASSAQEEADKAQVISDKLMGIRSEMMSLLNGAEELNNNAAEMGVASEQARVSATSIASAAEQQSAACEELLNTLEEQSLALSGAEQAGQALDILADELRASSNINKSAEEVAAAAEELSASIEEINRSSVEIAAALSQIARGATEAAAANEEASVGVAQIRNQVGDSEERARRVLENGRSMSTALTDNKVAVDAVVLAISATTDQASRSLKDIQELERVSRRIDKIVDAIANVAIQTSMLAVSGAVEAARAGEFGKGFAVVSADIQNLAEDAAENAEQIKDLVKAIQDQTVIVRDDLNQFSEHSRREVEKAQLTAKELDEVASDIQLVLRNSEEIVTSAQNVAEAVDQARAGIAQIATASEEASSSVEESSAAAQEQSNRIHELSIAIENIAATADELQSVV